MVSLRAAFPALSSSWQCYMIFLLPWGLTWSPAPRLRWLNRWQIQQLGWWPPTWQPTIWPSTWRKPRCCGSDRVLLNQCCTPNWECPCFSHDVDWDPWSKVRPWSEIGLAPNSTHLNHSIIGGCCWTSRFTSQEIWRLMFWELSLLARLAMSSRQLFSLTWDRKTLVQPWPPLYRCGSTTWPEPPAARAGMTLTGLSAFCNKLAFPRWTDSQSGLWWLTHGSPSGPWADLTSIRWLLCLAHLFHHAPGLACWVWGSLWQSSRWRHS